MMKNMEIKENKKGTPLWRALLLEHRLPYRYEGKLRFIYRKSPFYPIVRILACRYANFIYSKSQKVKNLSICAIFKNEAPYLKEWIEFHKLAGVEHFYLYNNNSFDDYLKVLDPYIKKGEITLIDWPAPPPCQVSAYADCLNKRKKETRWLAFIDIDEFLFATEKDNLVSVLQEYKNYPGVCVTSLYFGTSGHIKKPKGLQIKNFTRRAKIGSEYGRWIKLIVNPLLTLHPVRGPHLFNFVNWLLAADENKNPTEIDRIIKGSISKLRINHYWTRSKEEAEYRYKTMIGVNSTRKRGRMSDFKKDSVLNKVEDLTIQRFIPKLRYILKNHKDS